MIELAACTDPAGRTFRAMRLAGDGRSGTVANQVIAEEVLTLDVAEIGTYNLMWTPTRPLDGPVGYTPDDGVLADEPAPEPLALAAGFLLTEGLIDELSDIAEMAVCEQRLDVVRVRLANPAATNVRRRNVVMNSSCGVCGGGDQIAAQLAGRAPVSRRLRVAPSDLSRLGRALQQRQYVFRSTGGAHAALVFGADLGVRAFAEDLGRHNALDKVIGELLLRGETFSGCGVLVSSRLSYEMVAKSVRAGFELIGAISAPTSLAIDIAERAGITLCAFVRGEGAEVYSHPERIRSLVAVA
ncbi:formate dehydrogenase accessory sulfurtransferase FdhD [Aromatoleum sp.]|uniref:formate dehydrogenase accessory sulfurtransferase FdhD n=1 Tax=Aromatoleum sp. TaxID=2307007 RepID=UPI002FC6A2D1